ncbi:hypothetical protein [Actinomadura montaniterrae]|uniref:hypothetical protein n=1 Tax=Actinomadura montaniterrae TaxID=1803903 RepID=UPI001CEF6E58|nr:hypothetical protein [Actinomadura montaniterrae]
MPQWPDATCVVCPGQNLGPGEFDVVDRPDPTRAYDPAAGCRVDRATGAPVCVHPFRVGLPPGRYASAGESLPDLTAAATPSRPGVVEAVFVPTREQLELPEAVEDLEGWLIAMLRTARPDELRSALDQAETAAAVRFSGEQIITALRRVLATELDTARPTGL